MMRAAFGGAYDGARGCSEDLVMSVKSMAFGFVALALIVPLRAEPAPPDSAGGRFVFSKQADGFVRLDTQTGEVSLCSQRSVGWACQVAPDDRALLENEIARLRGENGALKKDLLSRGLPLPPGASSEPPEAQSDQPQNGTSNLRLPNDADVDRMVALAGRVWHRLLDAIDRAQKQVFNKS
jgi:hypothetical protein